MLTKNFYLIFIFGILASIASLYPTGAALKRDPSLKLYHRAQLEKQIMYLPILYGIIALVIFYVINNFFPENLQNYWVAGLLSGLTYATIKAIGKEAVDVYQVSNLKMFQIDVIFYPMLYGILFQHIAKSIC